MPSDFLHGESCLTSRPLGFLWFLNVFRVFFAIFGLDFMFSVDSDSLGQPQQAYQHNQSQNSRQVCSISKFFSGSTYSDTTTRSTQRLSRSTTSCSTVTTTTTTQSSEPRIQQLWVSVICATSSWPDEWFSAGTVRDSPRSWQVHLTQVLQKIGVSRMKSDPSVFTGRDSSGNVNLIVMAFVDGLAVPGESSSTQRFFQETRKFFSLIIVVVIIISGEVLSGDTEGLQSQTH